MTVSTLGIAAVVVRCFTAISKHTQNASSSIYSKVQVMVTFVSICIELQDDIINFHFLQHPSKRKISSSSNSSAGGDTDSVCIVLLKTRESARL